MPLNDYDPIFQAAGQEWNVDPSLLKAMAAQESSGRPGAVSKKGATGVMQVMPGTGQDMGMTDPTDPAQSIFAGAKYMSQLLDKYQDPAKALAAYNAGPGRVDDALSGKSPLPQETTAYVPKVAAYYRQFSQPGAPPAAPASATESPADFLARTAGAPKQEDPAAFLARTGGKGVEAPPPPQPSIDPITGFPLDGKGVPVPGAPTVLAGADQGTLSPGSAPAASRIGSAALEGAAAGFGSSPLGMSAQTEDALTKAGVFSGPNEYNPLKAINHAVIAPAAAVGDLILRGGNALVGAYQRGIAQTGEEIGQPQLGRDLAALPEAFPTGDFSGGTVMPHGAATTPAGPTVPRFVQEYYGEGTAANPLAAAPHPAIPAFIPPENSFLPPRPVEAPAFVPPGTDNPLMAARDAIPTPSTTPIPQSVGAAASRDTSHPSVIEMTPAQEQAYRATAEGQKLLEPQQPGIADRTGYVPGVSPNAAEIEQNVNTARELKALNVTAPGVSEEAKSIAALNNDARQIYHQKTIGSPVDIMNAVDARKAQLDQDYPAAFQGAKAADVSPVVDAIQSTLDDARGKQNTQLNKYIQPLMDRLVNEDGTPKITDPEELYGFREDLNRMRSKASQAGDPNLSHVSGELGDIIDATDGAIEKAAPGYRQYMDNYANASRKIDEMQVLQDHEPKLYDAQNRMTYNKVQTMMRQIVDARSGSGINPYKSISDDTMGRLWNLRDDLRRSASAQELARTAGSDTVQNAWDTAKDLGKLGATGIAHGVANVISPGFGSMGLSIARNALSPIFSARDARRQTARGMELLHPRSQNPLLP